MLLQRGVIGDHGELCPAAPRAAAHDVVRMAAAMADGLVEATAATGALDADAHVGGEVELALELVRGEDDLRHLAHLGGAVDQQVH